MILRDLKEKIRSGALRPTACTNALFPSVNILDIPEQGPWPDFIEACFDDATGIRYRLSVETYHGTGGVWETEGTSSSDGDEQ